MLALDVATVGQSEVLTGQLVGQLTLTPSIPDRTALRNLVFRPAVHKILHLQSFKQHRNQLHSNFNNEIKLHFFSIFFLRIKIDLKKKLNFKKIDK